MLKIFIMRSLLFVLILVSGEVFSQEGYNIKFDIENYNDSAILLTSYFGKKIKLIDTAYSDNGHTFIAKGDESLPGGVYMAVSSDKSKLFEFIIADDQHFVLSTDTINYAANMKVNGSVENKEFYNYLNYNEQQFKISKSLSSIIDSLEKENIDASEYKDKLEKHNKEMINYKLEIIDENTGFFVSSLISAMRDIEIPDSVKNSTDSTLSFKYYKSHYWDYIDLSDSCLLRSPVYMRKVDQYFDQLVAFHPDSVISAIDLIISKAQPNNEVVGYLVWYYISEYQNPKFMGFDKVFVHLVDNYFSKEDIQNTTPSILTSLQERADVLRPNLIGNLAPNMLLVDTLGGLRSFRELNNDYIVIFFWDFDCGICGKEIIELQKLDTCAKYDIGIYAVNVNGDIEQWKESIVKKNVPGLNVNGTRSATKDFHDLYDIYGTPVLYLLDQRKEIIAKRIGGSKVVDFLDNYLKNSNIE